MPEINVSSDIYRRCLEFKRVFDAVVDEEVDQSVYFEVLLGQGVDAMIDALLGSLDHSTLLRSIQQLGHEHPEQVYTHMVKTMRRGEHARIREQVQRQIGFHLPQKDEDDSQRN